MTATLTRRCKRHLDTDPVPATHFDVPIQFGGTYGEIDLCDSHMTTCTTDLWAWLRDAHLQEDVPEGARGRITVPVRLRVEDQDQDQDDEQQAPVVVYAGDERVPADLRLTMLERAQLPGTAMRWYLSDHTIKRMRERGIREYQVRLAAEKYTTNTPSKQSEDCKVRRNSNWKVIVNPFTLTVVTAMMWTENYDPDLPVVKLPAGRRRSDALAVTA